MTQEYQIVCVQFRLKYSYVAIIESLSIEKSFRIPVKDYLKAETLKARNLKVRKRRTVFKDKHIKLRLGF